MWLLLSRSHLHGESNSPQFAFYTDRFPNSWFFLVYVSGRGVFIVIQMKCAWTWLTGVPKSLALLVYSVVYFRCSNANLNLAEAK